MENTSSMAAVLRVADAIAELDIKRNEGDDMEVVERGYPRTLREEKRPYAELHLAGDSALQDGDLKSLDAAEKHFASALKQVHDRESPRLEEEEECLRKLGTVYVRRGTQTKDGRDFAKATALFNAAMARGGDEHLLIDSIKEAERLFLYHTVGIDCKPSPYETDIEHKDRLEEYRNEVKARLEAIHNENNPYQYDEDDLVVKEVEMKRAESVRDLFTEISRQRKDLFKDLVEECIKTIGPPPCQYAMVGLGSQATELVTPYSDLEFAILIEENQDTPENKEYFLNLTCYLYLKIINLGETILPAVGIKSLNDFHSEDPADSWFYDSVTPRGFAFDGAMPWASKTPFGREKTENKSAVSLIQTPAGMAKFQRHDIALAHGYHLSNVLRYVSHLTGDQTLVDDYMARVIQELETFNQQYKTTLAVRFARVSLSRTIQEHWRTPNGELLDVKTGIYRFPSVAIVNLGLLWGVYTARVWDIIKAMEEAGLISKDNSHHLQVLVSISGELRLRTYLELGGQKENLSGLSAMRKQQDTTDEMLVKSVFYMPDQKMLFRYYYTALPLGVTVSATAEHVLPLIGCKTFYDASSGVKADMCTKLLKFREVISHVKGGLREMEKENNFETREFGAEENLRLKSYLLGLRADSHRQLGDEREAVSCWEEQLKVQQQLYLGNFWKSVRDNEKALAFCEQALKMYQELYGLTTPHLETAKTLTDMGVVWEHFEDNFKAISFYKEALKMKKEIIGNNKEHPDIARVLGNLGSAYRKTGEYTKSLQCCERALEIFKSIHGEDKAHTSIAETLDNLARVYACLGDYKKSIQLYEDALDMERTIHGADKTREGDKVSHPDIAGVLDNLGHIWHAVGDNKKALVFFEQSLQMKRDLYGPTTPHLCSAKTLANMAKVLEKSGDKHKAISLYKEALKMKEEILKNKEHPDIVCLLDKLGSACRKVEEYPTSIQYYERALETNKNTHGQDTAHPSIAESLSNLAAVHQDFGDHTKAIQLYEEALNMRKVIHSGKETHGGDEACHPDIAHVLKNLGHLWLDVGDNEKACAFSEQALKMCQELYGPTTPHLDTALALSSIGAALEKSGEDHKAICEEATQMMVDVLEDNKEYLDISSFLCNFGKGFRMLGKYQKALQCCERALEMQKDIHGQDAVHPSIAKSLREVAAVYEALGNYTKAIQLYEDALNMAKVIHGANKAHSDIAGGLNNLGRLCCMNDNEKARILYEQALKMCKELYGRSTPHNDTVTSLFGMGVVSVRSGDFFRAINFYEEALKMVEGLRILNNKTDHPDIAMVLGNLALAYHKAGECTKSLQYCERTLEMIERIQGEEALHPNIAASLKNLEVVYEDLGDHTKAAQLYEDALHKSKAIHGGNGAHGADEACHPEIAGILSHLGCLWYNVGDIEKARPFWEQALKMYQELYGPTIPSHSTALALNNMGAVSVKSGENFMAISFYEEALKMMEEVLVGSEEHPHIALVLGNLGLAYHKAGENTKSRKYCERALRMIAGIGRENAADPAIATTLGEVAEVYEGLKDYAKVIQLYEDALDRVKTIHGTNKTHPAILKLLNNLETVRNKVGDQEKARSYHDQTRALKTAIGEEETPRDDTKSTDHRESRTLTLRESIM
ncbi:TTC28 [Branchiostoma lanceolatum]|uniref:TTC28 protein n=1 Tax=Branchiostoma lanceolatum TaxID=7740 RepID=A0A8K0EZU1_BRALA|nr:TTC28 [Branchiostoma lanceolatum]